MSDERRTMEPHDRLTRLCAVMLAALEADPGYSDDVKCVVLLDDGRRGGLASHGYASDEDVVVDMLMHVRAILRANGKDMDVLSIPDGPDS